MKIVLALFISAVGFLAQAKTIKFKPTTVVFNQTIELTKKEVLGGRGAHFKLSEDCYLHFWGDVISSFPKGTVLKGTSHIWDRDLDRESNELATELRFQSGEGDTVGFLCMGSSVPSYSEMLQMIRPYVTVK